MLPIQSPPELPKMSQQVKAGAPPETGSAPTPKAMMVRSMLGLGQLGVQWIALPSGAELP